MPAKVVLSITCDVCKKIENAEMPAHVDEGDVSYHIPEGWWMARNRNSWVCGDCMVELIKNDPDNIAMG